MNLTQKLREDNVDLSMEYFTFLYRINKNDNLIQWFQIVHLLINNSIIPCLANKLIDIQNVINKNRNEKQSIQNVFQIQLNK